MKMAEDRPPFALVRSSSRDNKVSCETLSHVDWYSTPKYECRDQFRYDADELYWDAADPQLDLDDDSDAHKVAKIFPASNLFSCFPPKSGSYLPPRTMVSPGREGKRGTVDTAGRPRTHPSPIPHSGGIPHSGALPHSGPIIKLNTGTIISHSSTGKGAAKSVSGPSIIPADVVGKKKPPGYDAQEPTSPEVTCLGHVRLKHKKQACEWKCKFFKQSVWMQACGWGQFKKAHSQPDLSNPAEIVEQNRDQRGAVLSDYVLQVTGDKGRVGVEVDKVEAEAEYVPQAPPPNSLLLMRGSRNLERESQKPGFFDTPEIPSKLPSVTKKATARQVSLPKPPPEASIWKRRNVSQPTALDTRVPDKLQVKEPRTK